MHPHITLFIISSFPFQQFFLIQTNIILYVHIIYNLYFICVFSDNECGYIHNEYNVSQVRKSNSNHHWYEFQFQTSSDVKRMVAFNITSHSNLRHCEQNKVLAQLKKLIIKENSNCIFNQQSVIHQALSFDVGFQHCVQPKPESACSTEEASTVTVSEVSELKANQKVHETAVITMGTENPVEVVLKSTGKTTNVKEDCVLEDSTGAILVHIWHPLIANIKTGQSYLLRNLTVKNFQGKTFLSTTPTTNVSPTSLTLQSVKGPDILENPEKEVTVAYLNMVSKLNVFSSCKVCNKKLNDIEPTHHTLKCQNCRPRQRTTDIKLQASAKLAIIVDGKELWLPAFTINSFLFLEIQRFH